MKNRNLTILVVVIVLVAGYFIYNRYTRVNVAATLQSDLSVQNRPLMEGMEGGMELTGGVVDNEGGMTGKSVDPALEQLRQASCFPKQQLTPDELLPKDNSSLWAQMNPSGSGSLKDRNFLQSGYHIGINTVGQTLRNANLQIRSEPPNPQVNVSPWLNSTIEPDINRRPFEIGGCA
jgi:hypothetical protein